MQDERRQTTELGEEVLVIISCGENDNCLICLYISVTAEQFPHLAAPMIKHLSTVQKLSDNFGDEA